MAKNQGRNNRGSPAQQPQREQRQPARIEATSDDDAYFEPRVEMEYPEPEERDGYTFFPREVPAE
jgi:hypothetical protein